jgi:hypothetical protein
MPATDDWFFALGRSVTTSVIVPTLADWGDEDRVLDLFRGKGGSARPLSVVVNRGRVFEDFMKGVPVTLVLVSDALVTALLDLQVTGWETYPIDFRTARGAVISGYQGLAITGRSGPIDRSRSHLRMRSRLKMGVFIDESSWDGSGMFMTEDRAAVLVRDWVAKKLAAASLSGVNVLHPSELSLGDST